MRKNLIVDLAIFVAFLIALAPSLTGIPFHEWFCLSLIGAIVLHLLLHWEWVIKVTLQYFRKLFHTSRLNYLIDVFLLITFITIALSGILISKSVLPTLGMQMEASRIWRFLHATSADLFLILFGLHFALHWKWLVNACKRCLVTPLKQRLAPRTFQPSPVPILKNRD